MESVVPTHKNGYLTADYAIALLEKKRGSGGSEDDQ